MSLGQRIRQVRGKMAQAEFGRTLGISQSTVGVYENESRFPDSRVLNAICNAFEISPEWLLMGTGPMRKNELVGEKISDCQRKMEPYSDQPIEKTSSTEIEKLRQSDILEVQRELMEALRQGMEFQKQVMALTRENADLRVRTVTDAAHIRDLERENAEIPALKTRITELERELSERPKLPKTVPVDVSAKSRPTPAHGVGQDTPVVPGAGVSGVENLGTVVRGDGE